MSDFAKIPLTQGQVAIIDAEDFERVSQYKWYANFDPRYADGGRFIAKTEIRINQKRTGLYLHRFILSASKGIEVDHKNGNTLDCRKKNLRLASRSQNNCNKTKVSSNTSGFKGVYFNKKLRRKPFFSFIQTNKKIVFLGYYHTAEEAAKAYDAGAVKYHGEFAKLNFPENIQTN